MKIKSDGGKLNIIESGAAHRGLRPSLIFLHYFGGSSQSWLQVIARLENSFHCLALDMRGFGDSQGFENNFTLDDYVDDLTAVVAELKLENFALAAHSMSGKIALLYAAQKPDNLQSLLLFAPSPPTPESMDDKERQRMLTTHGNPSAAEETVEKGIVRPLAPKVFEQAVADNLRSSPNAWQAWLETGSRADVSAQIKNIKIPILVAAGEQDENMTPKLLQREIINRLEHADLKVIADAKHLLPLEAANEVADLIEDFLAVN